MTVIRFPQERCSKDCNPPDDGICAVIVLPVIRVESFEGIARQMMRNQMDLVDCWMNILEWPL